MSPQLAVVIPVHDAGRYLDDQVAAVLAGIARAGIDAELVLADDGSTDGAVARVAARAADGPTPVVVVASDVAEGPSRARNRGIDAATADRIALCDADDLVAPDWVAAMAGAIGPATPYVTGPLDVDSLNPPHLRDSRGRGAYEAVPRFADVVPFAHGCNVGLHRSLLEAVGGFAEDRWVAEDIELGVRAWRHGTALTWEPRAVVAYRFRSDWRRAYRQGRAYGRAAADLAGLLPEHDLGRPSWTAEARRVAWLVRAAPRAARRRADRARWLWVLSQLDGRTRDAVAARLGQRTPRATTSS